MRSGGPGPQVSPPGRGAQGENVGRLFVLEGLDGAGTTTQAARLAAWLEAHGRSVVRTAEPTDLAIGRLIRAVLRAGPDAPSRASLPWLFAADRADHLDRRVLPALAQGHDVVSDRYLHSSLAYQSLERDMHEVAALNATFPSPAVVFFLRVPVDLALRRIAGRGDPGEIYERSDALRRVSDAYDAALALRRRAGDNIVEIDGSAPVDAVTASIVAALPA